MITWICRVYSGYKRDVYMTVEVPKKVSIPHWNQQMSEPDVMPKSQFCHVNVIRTRTPITHGKGETRGASPHKLTTFDDC